MSTRHPLRIPLKAATAGYKQNSDCSTQESCFALIYVTIIYQQRQQPQNKYLFTHTPTHLIIINKYATHHTNQGQRLHNGN